MVEITRHNFEETLVDFKSHVSKCSFLAVDCEFTSLPGFEKSLFDSGDERYQQLKNSLNECVILQVGVTSFKYQRDLNNFKAKPYKFYICPSPFGPFDVTLSFKSSAIQFLCDHQFDFNKSFYDGVTYMNLSNKRVIRKELYDRTLPNTLVNNLNFDEVHEIMQNAEVVDKWKENTPLGREETIPFPKRPHNCAFNYLLQEKIRRLDNVWASCESNSIVVKKVSKERKLSLIVDENNPEVKEKFIDELSGFSLVYDILASSKKPLIGHNLYLDLLIMYHQFYEHLPGSYNKFKENLHSQFPCIFDTKLLIFELQRLKKEDSLKQKQTALEEIFKRYQNLKYKVYLPPVVLEENGIYSEAGEKKAHDAGWDSYMTGFIFLKIANDIAHIFRKQETIKDYTWSELLKATKTWENKINLPRAKISYLNLNGPDPKSTRPPLLHVSTVGRRDLDKLELDILLNKYGPLHKKSINSYSALIAVPNYNCYKKILIDFNSSAELNIEKYSIFRHHRFFRTGLIAGVILPTIFTLWFIIKRR